MAEPRATFRHPGLLHTQTDFDRVAGFVKAKKQPWYAGWQKLVNHSNPNYTPRPVPTVYRGTGSPENYPNLYRDAAAAYVNAIYWKVTGDEEYALGAGRILDGWSSTLKSVEGSSDKFLASGLYGYQLANAGEILRGYTGWKGLPALVKMLTDVFYPMNHDFLLNHNGAKIDHYWANWDLCNLCSMHSIGVLADNGTMANEATTYFKSGAGNGAIKNAIWTLHEESGTKEILGQGQEAGRDQGHAMLDFALLGVLAQQSYNQGDDLFGYLDNRILAGSGSQIQNYKSEMNTNLIRAEYAAKYNLGQDVPYTPYSNSDVTQSVISPASRGDIRPIWELLFGHYGMIKGLNVSWAKQYRDLVVANGNGAEGGGGDYGTTSGGYDQLGYGTLLYRLDG
jgi:hypothetical protein